MQTEYEQMNYKADACKELIKKMANDGTSGYKLKLHRNNCVAHQRVHYKLEILVPVMKYRAMSPDDEELDAIFARNEEYAVDGMTDCMMATLFDKLVIVLLLLIALPKSHRKRLRE